MKKLSLFIMFVLAFALTLNFTFNSDPGNKNKAYPNIAVTGDETPSYVPSGYVINTDGNPTPQIYNTDNAVITLVETGGASIYDLQGNGVPQYIQMDPANPNNVHAVYIVNLSPGIPGADRRVSYYFSSNKGTTWDYLGDVPDQVAAGFPAIDLLSNSAALIANHDVAGGAPAARTQCFVDQGPGVGVFTRLDPNVPPHSSGLPAIWPRVIATDNITNTNKFFVVGSFNVSVAMDTVTESNICTNMSSTPGTWTGWKGETRINNAETYNLARSASGKLGLAYLVNDNGATNLIGDVEYKESTDDGSTWSAPVICSDAELVGADELYGTLRGVDVVFQGETPKVVLEWIRQTTASSYYPGLGSKIKFWSPNVNGGTAIVIADSSSNPNFGNPNGGATDVYTPICRPTIGVSSNNAALFCAFEVSRADTDAIGSHFYDVYMTYSVNGGANWSSDFLKVTNNSGPVRDFRFVSLSPWNDVSGANYYANLVMQRDSVPGSVTQTPPASESIARQVFARVEYTNLIGIKPIGSEIPMSFNLHQNFPNPFNPSTKIRFEMPKSEFVTLNLYNAAGQLVGTLVNELVSAGVKEYEFNASSLPSGVYFYTLKAGSFTDTKKMVLIK